MVDAATQRDCLVLGLGATGVSCVRHLLGAGQRVLAMDSRDVPPGLAEVRALAAGAAGRLEVLTGALDPARLDGIGRMVVSPGIPLSHPMVREAVRRGVEVTGDIELFAHRVTVPVVAVTGTNGKSTVTTLVDLMLRGAGRRSLAAGNIGRAALDALDDAQRSEFVVLELSSFQLERTASLRPAVAVLLNVSDDHLDHHGSFEAYVEAKRRVFLGARAAVVGAEQRALLAPPADMPCRTFSAQSADADYRLLERAGEGWLARGDTPLLRCAALRLVGRHNLANALAAMAAVELLLGDLPPGALAALAAFAGLPHRMRHVRTRGDVRFIDDSKATNVGAALAAIDGLSGPLVLIAGGRGKGADFTPLGPALAGRARAVLLFGEDAGRLEAALAGHCPTERVTDLEEAVTRAAAIARAGDTVLLAPACASLDMFRDYSHRGEVFSRCVEALS